MLRFPKKEDSVQFHCGTECSGFQNKNVSSDNSNSMITVCDVVLLWNLFIFQTCYLFTASGIAYLEKVLL